MHGSGVWTQANSVVYCGKHTSIESFAPSKGYISGTWDNDVIAGTAVKTTTSSSNKCVVLFENGAG